jgi:hypothetical protein
VVLPLQEADPNDDLGQFLGGRVDLDAGQLRGADLRQQGQAATRGVGDDLFLQRKLPEPQAGVEDGDVGERLDEVLERSFAAAQLAGLGLRRAADAPKVRRQIGYDPLSLDQGLHKTLRHDAKRMGMSQFHLLTCSSFQGTPAVRFLLSSRAAQSCTSTVSAYARHRPANSLS